MISLTDPNWSVMAGRDIPRSPWRHTMEPMDSPLALAKRI